MPSFKTVQALHGGLELLCDLWGEGDLKCPAYSNQDNGLEVYGRFLETVAEFRNLESLSVSVKFNDEYDAEMFIKNQAKWHKTCHLKFVSSKLLQLQKRKSSLEPGSVQQQRKSKRQRTSHNSDQNSCMFCSEISGTLHNCTTMKLDQDIRRMATDLQDSLLLARISSGDLMAIEAKYYFNCLSAFKNKYQSTQGPQKSSSNSQEKEVIQAQVFAGLTLYIKENIESGNYME